MSIRDKLLDEGTGTEDLERQVTVEIGDELHELVVKPLSLRQQAKAQNAVAQGEDNVPMTVLYIIFGTYNQEGERIFEFPTDIDQLCELRNHEWVERLINASLVANGVDVPDAQLKKKQRPEPRREEEAEEGTEEA